MSLTAAHLLVYDARERRRRTSARPAVLRLLGLPGVSAVLVGLAGAGLIAWRAHSCEDAAELWLTGALVGVAVVIMRGPWRLYWRPGATLLARLPIDGGALYGLAVARSAAAAAQVLVIAGVASIALAHCRRDLLATLALVAGACTCAALVAPAASAFAGAMIVSEKAQRALDSLTGEFPVPRVMWLSILPALGVAFVAGGALVLVPWATGGTSGVAAPAAIAAGVAGSSVLLLLAGLLVARTTLSAATLEVAAMDRVRLAHVDLVGARGLERLWGRLVAPGVVYTKDVAVLRRRFPLYYILNGVAVLAMWQAAVRGDPAVSRWVLAMCVAAGAYAIVLARRLVTPPAEPARLLAVLPFSTGVLLRAKIAYLAWRTLWVFGLGATPGIVRSADPQQLALIVSVTAIGSLVGGAVVVHAGLRRTTA